MARLDNKGASTPQAVRAHEIMVLLTTYFEKWRQIFETIGDALDPKCCSFDRLSGKRRHEHVDTARLLMGELFSFSALNAELYFSLARVSHVQIV